MRNPRGPKDQEQPGPPPTQRRMPRARVLLYNEETAHTRSTRPDESPERSAQAETEKDPDARGQVSAAIWKRAEFIFVIIFLILMVGWAAILFLPFRIF
jgi:hypothetical protein